MDVLLILVTVPSREVGDKIASELVKRNLAACVNIVPDIVSIYRWQEKLCHDGECLLLIKSHNDVWEQLNETVLSLHPNELPEIIAFDITTGLERYLSWVVNETH